jgi:hypothetical protein
VLPAPLVAATLLEDPPLLALLVESDDPPQPARPTTRPAVAMSASAPGRVRVLIRDP